jgi:hypothetical protein
MRRVFLGAHWAGLADGGEGGGQLPMAQFVEQGAGDGFAIQACPWIGTEDNQQAAHVGHFWLGGWDSTYTDGAPQWEPLASCEDSRTLRATRCSQPHAWNPHAYLLLAGTPWYWVSETSLRN